MAFWRYRGGHVAVKTDFKKKNISGRFQKNIAHYWPFKKKYIYILPIGGKYPGLPSSRERHNSQYGQLVATGQIDYPTSLVLMFLN
jgi:hypothetical protein